jgi:hypothetical protein
MRSERKKRAAGEFGLTVEDAGAMIGLSRSASYRAAGEGQIPTIRAGRSKIVPKAIWFRRLGLGIAREPEAARKALAEVELTA